MLLRISIKSVTALLLVSFLIPSVLLLYPQKKVEAAGGTDCVGVVAGALAAALAINSTKETIGVTTGTSDAQTNAVSAGAGYGTFFKDCILVPLAIKMAKALLNDMTRQTVKWINSGFKGNPGFATNLSGMLRDTADEVIGDFIAKEAPFLCSQFSFQLRIALAQSNLPYRKRSACTLTRIINNANAFIDGNGRGSWDNWLEITTKPQNNAYGAFTIAQDELSKRIINAQELEKTYLNWGNGFKDWEFCETDTETGEEECRKETPGKIVQDRLSATLNVDLQQIGLADDLNAVYDALTNQLVKQIMTGAAGILGGNRGPRRTVVAPSDYAAAARPTVINGGSDLGGAINSGIENGTNVAINQFDSSTTETATNGLPGGTGNGVVTLGPPTGGQTAGITVSPSSSTEVTAQKPLIYEAAFNTNYLTGGLTFRIAFKRADNLSDTPFLGAFPFVNIEYTLSNGTTKRAVITDRNQATVTWVDVGTDINKPFTVKLTAVKGTGVIAGNYTLETVVYDNNANFFDVQKHNITIR